MFQLRHLFLLSLLLSCTVAYAEPVDTLDAGKQKANILSRLVGFFANSNREVPRDGLSVSVIGGPFYSSDVKFGLGLVVAGQYHHGTDTLAIPSIASLKAKLSTTLFYGIGIEGLHIFPGDQLRLQYNIDFQSMPTYFWGIGYAAGRDTDNKTKYTDKRVNVRIDALARLSGPLFVGGLIQGCHAEAEKIHNPDFWNGLPRHVTGFAIGAEVRYDSRDIPQNAYSGWELILAGKWWPKFLSNGNAFGSVEFSASHYHPVWNGGILAGRFHTICTMHNTPWALMPTYGGSNIMRGYYEGQYRDKCEFDMTFELRQHVWRRSGVVAWVGFGSIFPYVSALRLNHILPNAGIGYRWEFKKRVNVRLDLGIGKGCYGIEFGIHEAF